MIERNADILCMSVSQLEKQLLKVYSSLIEKDIPFKTFPSVMLWGPPGVGKSQSVRHMAAKLEKKTKKKVIWKVLFKQMQV